MADEPDFTEITIRDEFGNERVIAKHALPFWPAWERIDSPARKVTTPSEKKEN